MVIALIKSGVFLEGEKEKDHSGVLGVGGCCADGLGSSCKIKMTYFAKNLSTQSQAEMVSNNVVLESFYK